MNKGKVDVLLGLNIPRWKGQYHRERCGVGT